MSSALSGLDVCAWWTFSLIRQGEIRECIACYECSKCSHRCRLAGLLIYSNKVVPCCQQGMAVWQYHLRHRTHPKVPWHKCTHPRVIVAHGGPHDLSQVPFIFSGCLETNAQSSQFSFKCCCALASAFLRSHVLLQGNRLHRIAPKGCAQCGL